MAGGVICGLGFGLCLLATNLLELAVFYGLIAGSGLGLMYIPTIVSVNYYLFLIIGWELRVSRMGPLRSGPRGRTDGVGQYKTPGMRDSIRAQRGRARSALFF